MAAELPISSGCTANPGDDTSALESDGETDALNWLLDAFPSISLEEIASAYSSANCDASRAAEILTSLGESGAAPASLAGPPGEAFEKISDLEMLVTHKANQNQNSTKANRTSKGSNGRKPKKFSVATGLVSSVLGNGYARPMNHQNETQRRGSLRKSKGKGNEKIMPLEPTVAKDSMQGRQVEEFLYSMMGDESQLDMDIVRDVLRQCGYNIQKSLDRLLDMAVTSSKFVYNNGSLSTSSRDHGSEEESLIDVSFRVLSESFPDRDQDELLKACKAARGDLDQAMSILLDKEKLNASKAKGEFFNQKHVTEDNCNSKSTLEQLKLGFPELSESTLNEILESVNFSYRYCEARNILLEAGLGPEPIKNVDRPNADKSSLSRQVLDSLFNISESCERIPSDMDWMKTVKTRKKSKRKTEIASTGNQLEPAMALSADGEEDEYQCFRKTASQHWGTMRSYFQEAAEAYSNGERARAAYLSEQGKLYKQLAREADEKASQRIFEFKNRDMRNDITIDLHAQHVKDALHLLKLHIKSLACISSIHCLKVITGDSEGSRGGKIKRAVSQLLEREGINWTEETTGMLVIKMTDVNPDNLSFANTDSDG